MNLFNLSELKEKVKELNKLQMEPDFWNDGQKAQKNNKRKQSL